MTRTYQWKVFFVELIGSKPMETYLDTVEAETASDAIAYISRTRWIPATSLRAYPEESE